MKWGACTLEGIMWWVVLGRYHWWELNKYSSRQASQKSLTSAYNKEEDEEKNHSCFVWAYEIPIMCLMGCDVPTPRKSPVLLQIKPLNGGRNFEDQSGDCWGRSGQSKDPTFKWNGPSIIWWVDAQSHRLQEHASLSYSLGLQIIYIYGHQYEFA